MKHQHRIALVKTIEERCRVCYTCVRECPAKAIRITEGQAAVMSDRCIGCGNCVRVCSQNAKQVVSSTEAVDALLAGDARVAAIIAPSFPAEFIDVKWPVLVSMIRAMGFDWVNEVAFGADLVAERYQRLISRTNDQRFIATSCPAIVAYVERYHPTLVGALAPIVSPMVAQARALRVLHGDDLKVVFLGPCIAKKGETLDDGVADEIDAALTFTELREMFARRAIAPEATPGEDFDPPFAAAGALFPISRGLLQAAGIKEDLKDEDVVVADGRAHFVEALKAFENGDLQARLLEILACPGCIMGPGMGNEGSLFSRRSRVSRFVREMAQVRDVGRWRADMGKLAALDLSRGFHADDQRMAVPFDQEIAMIMAKMGKHEPADELNCGACGYDTCREHAIAIFKGLAESEMCLPNTIEQLHSTIKELAVSNDQLATAQEALIQSEKLASMGQLAAGIAHEVNNPLGVVLMYSHLLADQCVDQPELYDDVKMIAEQADRCKKIVSGLLNFARQNKVFRQATDVGTLVIRSAAAMARPDNVTLTVETGQHPIIAEIDGDQIAQVLTNLVSNALAAMPDGGALTVRAEQDGGVVRIVVADTGCGISEENLKKIFEPFFTTKQIGKGTGLGLAVTYGIVKMHRGEIGVESNARIDDGPTGTTFTVTLPLSGADD